MSNTSNPPLPPCIPRSTLSVGQCHREGVGGCGRLPFVRLLLCALVKSSWLLHVCYLVTQI